MTVIAIIAIGWYAVRVLPSSFSKSANEPQPNIVRADATDPVRGMSNASKTIIEFGDLECPTCGALDPHSTIL